MPGLAVYNRRDEHGKVYSCTRTTTTFLIANFVLKAALYDVAVSSNLGAKIIAIKAQLASLN